MRVLFWGTPAFAVPALRALSGEGHDIVGVVTQPDRPAGRGLGVAISAVKALALEVARQYPGLHLLPGLSWDRGDVIISLGASTVLPVLNRNRGPIMEAMARRRETAARVLQLQAVVLGQLDSALAGYRVASLAVGDADSLLAVERRRLDTALMRAEPGRVLAKSGAEGVQAAALVGEGHGFALKIEDGDAAQRARNVATCEGLGQIGALTVARALPRTEYAAAMVWSRVFWL